MDHKSGVLKSKSSNSAITTKSDKSSKKKTRSNAEFQPVTLKKRGVYVEKKNTKLNLNSIDNKGAVKGPQRPSRPPPRPRKGQKKFLASVLTILSKNTASTQYPDGPRAPDSPITVEKDNETKPVRVKRMKRLNVETSEKETQDTLEKKKTKYRSRVLNNMMQKDSKKVVILQNRKEITHTPSNYSNKSYKELSDAKYKSLPPLCNYEDFDDYNDDDSNTMKSLVAKGQAAAQAQKDPITLVSENPQKDEKRLYNFFVDLLETTFSVYNVKTDFNQVHTPSEYGSKVVFEMDENVAEKLCVTKDQSDDRNEKEETVAATCCINKKRFSINDQIHFDRPKSPPISSKPYSNRRQYKRKLKSESFFYQNPKFKMISPPQSVIMNKRSFHKRNRKQTFLNMLKEQLRMNDYTFEEPQNMHQALKIIARNNRRNRKAIHFADDATRTDEDDQRKQECMFKRRKVISSSTKSTKKNYKFNKDEKIIDKTFRTDTISRKFSDPTVVSKYLPKSGYSTEDEQTESYHSLEVHGYDYDFEATPTKRLIENKNKKILFAAKSSSTCCKDPFSPNTSIEMLKFTASSSSDSLASL